MEDPTISKAYCTVAQEARKITLKSPSLVVYERVGLGTIG